MLEALVADQVQLSHQHPCQSVLAGQMPQAVQAALMAM